MRIFLITCLVSFAAAQSGYNYQKPLTSDGFMGMNMRDEEGIGAASSLEPEIGGKFGQASQPQTSDGTIIKRFFTVSAEDKEDDDDDDYDQQGGQKNIDIIFAHAPQPSINSALKAIQRYAGERQTAVYILSKKLGAEEIGNALRNSGIKQTKPEVHFIKYKTPEEAAHAQRQIKAQYDALGGTSHNEGEASAPVESVIGSVGKYPKNGYRQGGYKAQGSSPTEFREHLGSNRYLPPKHKNLF